MARKRSIESVIAALPNFVTLDVSTYKGTNYNARFVDSEYGEFTSRVDVVLLNQKGHPQRAKNKMSESAKLSNEEVSKRLPDYIQSIDYSSYKSNNVLAKFIDCEYGEYWSRPAHVFRGLGDHPKRISAKRKG